MSDLLSRSEQRVDIKTSVVVENVRSFRASQMRETLRAQTITSTPISSLFTGRFENRTAVVSLRNSLFSSDMKRSLTFLNKLEIAKQLVTEGRLLGYVSRTLNSQRVIFG